MRRFGLIGGTGAQALIPNLAVSRFTIPTPYGETSAPVCQWQTETTQWLFIARHGDDGRLPPHKVNYRANVWALRQADCEQAIGINAVGGIHEAAVPGRLVFPDQLVDYTWGREHTYSDGPPAVINHIEFTSPVSTDVHAMLVNKARGTNLDFVSSGTYAVSQGPRLETAAEINRFERDGCSIVGMTAMPEAALAAELAIEFAICAVVVNWAAGRSPKGAGIHAEMEAHLQRGMAQVERLIGAL